MTLIDSNGLYVFEMLKMMYRQVQQQPVEVNVNGIPIFMLFITLIDSNDLKIS